MEEREGVGLVRRTPGTLEGSTGHAGFSLLDQAEPEVRQSPVSRTCDAPKAGGSSGKRRGTCEIELKVGLGMKSGLVPEDRKNNLCSQAEVFLHYFSASLHFSPDTD